MLSSDDWNARREVVLRFAQRKLAKGELERDAIQVIEIQMSRGINDHSKRLKCIEHIEVELGGTDGFAELHLNKWKRLYSKSRRRKPGADTTVELPATTRMSTYQHRRASRKSNCGQRNQRNGNRRATNQRLCLLVREEGTLGHPHGYSPSPPSRVVSHKRFFVRYTVKNRKKQSRSRDKKVTTATTEKSSCSISSNFLCLGISIIKLIGGFLPVDTMLSCNIACSNLHVPMLGAASARVLQQISEEKLVNEYVETITASDPEIAKLISEFDQIADWFEASKSEMPPNCRQNFGLIIRLLRSTDDIVSRQSEQQELKDKLIHNYIREYVKHSELSDAGKIIAPIVFEKCNYPLYGLGLIAEDDQTESFRPDHHRLITVENPLIPYCSSRRFAK